MANWCTLKKALDSADKQDFAAIISATYGRNGKGRYHWSQYRLGDALEESGFAVSPDVIARHRRQTCRSCDAAGYMLEG